MERPGSGGVECVLMVCRGTTSSPASIPPEALPFYYMHSPSYLDHHSHLLAQGAVLCWCQPGTAVFGCVRWMWPCCADHSGCDQLSGCSLPRLSAANRALLSLFGSCLPCSQQHFAFFLSSLPARYNSAPTVRTTSGNDMEFHL